MVHRIRELYLASHLVLSDLTFNQRKKFSHDIMKFFWDEPNLYWSCDDRVIRFCVLEVEMLSVLEACNSSHVCGYHNGI